VSRTLLLAAASLLLFPELAHACAVCGQAIGDDQSRVAYLITSAVLSVLPVGLVGAFLLWLRHKSRRRPSAAPTTAPATQPHANPS